MDNRVLADLHFDGFWDWFVHYTPVEPLLKNQPTYLIVQASFLLGGILTLLHALRGRGRLPYLWLATLLHGLVVESLCYVLPDVDNFWHSQSPLIFLGRRLPIHIIFLYPCFIYQASIAAAQLKLPRWAEPFAVGLLVVLIDIPYDIVSVKFVHWSWHDTDPNIADRHYWVPWNSYYFHLTFAASFTFWFHTVRKWLDRKTAKWQSSRFGAEFLTMILAAVLGPLGGIALFVPIYHPLHDLYKIHSEVTFFILFSIALLLAWSGEKYPAKDGEVRLRWRWLPLLALLVHYLVFLSLVIFGQPEKEISVGLHEPIGPCNLTRPVQTILGVLSKREFLCAKDYDESYYDFHCAPGGVPKGTAKWYTICGTPFQNRPEYIAVISTLTMLALGIISNIYFKSKKDTQDTRTLNVKKQKSH
ncbi:uncharacterized protein LOC129005755 [Macrosteles quadrilineatus]|uniref:uncharacterized protein LOC129005755 n=1 Tax=Macrosteles quadrilineatus TaxID=74068 RepID=UPI0023E120CE|nr:uncharacterized protein LOC129005755 [Macrosteles quadrilineatus]